MTSANYLGKILFVHLLKEGGKPNELRIKFAKLAKIVDFMPKTVDLLLKS